MFPPVVVKSVIDTKLDPVMANVNELVGQSAVLLTVKGRLNGWTSIPI